LHKFPGLRFDFFIGVKGKDTPYLAEIKGKESYFCRGWVDRDLYNGYYELSNLPFPLLYFVWVKENNKIYRHTITNPENFETKYSGGTVIYVIPPELIHEVKLKDDIMLKMCKTSKSLNRSYKRFLDRVARG